MLYNNFFYIQLASTFITWKDFYYGLDNTDTFFFFFFSKVLISFTGFFFAFCFSLLQKDIDIFCVVLFGVFLYFLIISIVIFIYRKKFIKNILLVFLSALKLSLKYELSKLNELCKFYELCKLYELCKYFMNWLKSLEIIWIAVTIIFLFLKILIFFC